MSGSILAYLEHELCDHSVELGALVAKALLPCTQGPKQKTKVKNQKAISWNIPNKT